ncbi:unnamed protein product, partial [Owenia fusiformis]
FYLFQYLHMASSTNWITGNGRRSSGVSCPSSSLNVYCYAYFEGSIVPVIGAVSLESSTLLYDYFYCSKNTYHVQVHGNSNVDVEECPTCPTQVHLVFVLDAIVAV